MSILSVASRAISDDSSIFKKNWRDLNFNYKKCPFQCVNWNYIARVLFRLIDVFARISFLSLIWVAIRGYFTAILIIIDFMIVAKISWDNKKYVK